MSATISPEATKAAMEVFYRYGYSNFADAEHAFAEAQTRAALEAALPHLTAYPLTGADVGNPCDCWENYP